MEHDLEHDTSSAAELARQRHVDSRTQLRVGTSRAVWDNPILWREICTWAYGRKVLIIRIVYLLLFAMAWAAVHWAVQAELAAGPRDEYTTLLPAATVPIAVFGLVSLVIVNALAVTSITNERDGQALDLLLVTDLSSKEFVLGKLGGVLWVTKEMVILPMLLCIYVWWCRAIHLENLLYVLGGLVTMNVFVSSLGVHCGMTYANSRTAIGVSLGDGLFPVSGCRGVHDHDGQVQQQFPQSAATVPGLDIGRGCRIVRRLGNSQSIRRHHAGRFIASVCDVFRHHEFPVA